MAEIRLTTSLDKTGISRGFDDLAKAPDKFTNAVKKSAKDSKKALEDLSKTAKTPNIVPPVTGKEVNALKALKKEIKDLQSAAIKAGKGTEEYARLLDLAASKAADLRDLQDVVKSLDPDVKAAAFTNLASTAVGAGQGIAGAFALAGIEGENYQKLLVRLQGIEAIGQGIKSIGQLQDEWGKAKIAINSYLLRLEAKVLGEQVNAAVTAEGAVAQEAATVAAVQNTEAITAQTLAQRALALAQAATPWGAIAIAVGVVAAAIGAYVASSQAAAEADRIRNTAADGTVLANKELRDSYNELLKAQSDFRLDLEVLTGGLSKYDAELQKISNTYKQKLMDAQAEYNASLAEEDTWYNNLIPAQTLYNQTAGEVERMKARETAATQALIDKQKEELALKNELAKANLASGIDLQIETLNTQLALTEAAGKSTFDLQRQIAEKEAEGARLRANDAIDSANQLAIVEQQLSQKLIKIDEAQANEQEKIAQESANKRLKIQEDLFSKLAALQKSINGQDQGNLSPEVKAKQDLEANLAAIQDLARESYADQQSLTAAQKKDIEDSLNALVDESYRQYYDKLTELKSEQIKKEAEMDQATFTTRLQRLEASQQIEMNDIELWQQQQGESEEAFEKRKNDAKLKLQLQFAQSRLAILQEQGAAENAVEVSNLQVTIKNLQSEIEKSGQQSKQIGKNFIMKLLGLDEAGYEKVKQNFEELLNVASDTAQKLLDAQQEALDRKKELNDQELQENERRLSELQSQLDRELEEQRLGRANNVKGIQDAIAQENKAREDQLNKRRQLEAEQARLARQRNLVESAQQLSSIITAVANIIEGWSEVPLIGSVLGIAAAGLMLGSFVGLKAKAAAATAPGFKTGTKNAPPGFKWVGEEGPELIHDKGGYAIINNKDSEKLMSKYGIPAYRPDLNDSALEYISSAASSGRNSMSVNVDAKGTEKRLDQIIELNQKSTVRSVNRKR